MREYSYIRKVQYHETDKMGITHHSNYIKWMEEARIDFLEKIGYGYDKLEEDGIISPVIGVNCEYKHPSTFGDTIKVQVEVIEFKKIKLFIRYLMTKVDTGEIVAKGTTSHCFVNEAGRPIVLERQFPEFDNVLKSLVVEE